jgi:uncharacterized RDD family membrane protein YckC
MANAATIASTTHYAGFWRRFVAALIDGIIVNVVFWILSRFLPLYEDQTFSAGDMSFDLHISLTMLGMVISIVMSWLYWALLESSARGATVGKMAMGVRVTDLSGARISFGRATGRYFAKILSAVILLIGFIMQAFTARRQALHDILAGTLVVKT